MKIYNLCIALALLALSSCGVRTDTNKAAQTSDSTASQPTEVLLKNTLVTEMKMKDSFKVGDSIALTFTVYNRTDKPQRFCVWHTPFEPLMSKYLDVIAENGEDVPYQGAMAKRMMPPPESSYLTIDPKNNASIEVNLLRGYAIKNPGKYTVTYVGENMSGLKVEKSVSFTYVK